MSLAVSKKIYPFVVLFKEINDIRLFLIDNEQDMHNMALFILNERFQAEWYDNKHHMYISNILNDKDGLSAYEFLYERSIYEYEEMEEYWPEKIEKIP